MFGKADPLSRIEKLCAEKGLRMTEQRRVIARVLSESADHPDAEELYRRASTIDPHISIATVYRTVKLFEDAGILERHDFRDGRSIIYAVNFDTMRDLLVFLTEDCCAGNSEVCAPLMEIAERALCCDQRKGDAHEAPARSRRGR